MKISIGTLSKAFDLSDEALRFYEKKGLLRPHREGGSGYRVFERADIQRIANVKRLKNQGFTLDEIQTVYSCIGKDALETLYAQKLEQARQEIAYRERVLAHMQAAWKTLREEPDRLLLPQELNPGVFYMLEYPSIEAMWERLPHEPVLKRLFRQLPLTGYTTIIKKEALAGEAYRISKGVLLHESDALALGVDAQGFRRMDAGRAVGCLFCVENGRFDVCELLDTLAAYLREKGLRATDDLFTVQQISFVNEHGDAMHYSSMMVPITEK
ncbi:MAG: MerR family transcriptional regulator [Clostridiales bacterium]|nr:MerR family transcriptional regulator [Clostridiales bacterium]